MWRVGKKLGRTLYLNDEIVGMMDTPQLAEAVVARMNADTTPRVPPLRIYTEAMKCRSCGCAYKHEPHASNCPRRDELCKHGTLLALCKECP